MFALYETNVFRVSCAPVNTRQGVFRLPQLVRCDDLKPSDGVAYACPIAPMTELSWRNGNAVALSSATNRWHGAVGMYGTRATQARAFWPLTKEMPLVSTQR